MGSGKGEGKGEDEEEHKTSAAAGDRWPHLVGSWCRDGPLPDPDSTHPGFINVRCSADGGMEIDTSDLPGENENIRGTWTVAWGALVLLGKSGPLFVGKAIRIPEAEFGTIWLNRN